MIVTITCKSETHSHSLHVTLAQKHKNIITVGGITINSGWQNGARYPPIRCNFFFSTSPAKQRQVNYYTNIRQTGL